MRKLKILILSLLVASGCTASSNLNSVTDVKIIKKNYRKELPDYSSQLGEVYRYKKNFFKVEGKCLTKSSTCPVETYLKRFYENY